MSMNDEEFCALLMEREPVADAEAEELRGALRGYRAERLLWAERRSAGMPSLAAAARRGEFRAALPQWSLAAVAVMTVAVAAVHFNSAPQQTATDGTPATMTQTMSAAATPQQISQDNDLLNQIDAAVNAGTGLPVNALGLDAPRGAGRAHGSME